MQRIRKSFFALAVTAGLLVGASMAVTPAKAASLPFNFTGDIFTSQSPLTPTILTSHSVVGTFTFNDSTGAVEAFSMNFLNLSSVVVYTTTQGVGANEVTIINNGPLGGGAFGDRWQLETKATSLTPISTFSPLSFDIQLDGDTGGVSSLLTSSALQSPPSISGNPDLTSNRWRLIFDDGGLTTRVVLGSLTSLTAVPLPPAVILFGAGLIALIGLGARNRQRAENSVA